MPSLMGSSIVLCEVLGCELLCGDWLSSIIKGGVAAVDMSSCGGRCPVVDEADEGWAVVRVDGGSEVIRRSIWPICLP